MELLIVGVIKFIDNAISTTKNILLYKGRYISSSIMVFISSWIFCYIVGSLSNDDSLKTTLVVSIFSALGAYIASIVGDKFEKDKTYINIITCNSTQEVNELCQYLKLHNIANVMLKSYNQGDERGLTLLIFARTKSESKLISKYLSNSNENFLREIIN